ncbi:hypothetical protein KAR91_14595, partial [Candidatus Pacearchaeota archaeon]|nr:hypothetical protein [Candidatus Pacearchaeota archaeon]
DELAFLETLRRILVKEGKLYISVPAHNFLWSNNDKNAGHFRRYTISKLRRLLSQTGFNVDYATYFFALMPLPILLYRTIPSRLGRYRNITPELKQKELILKKGRIKPFVDWLLKRELERIRQKRSISFGSSCLVVGSKPR